MRFGFVHNPTNPDAVAALARARAWSEAHGVEGGTSAAEDREAVAAACRGSVLVCILGGDGTFLRTARALGDSGVALMGVNLGRVGFLAKVETDELERALDQVLAGDYAVEERLRIAATIVRGDGSSETHA